MHVIIIVTVHCISVISLIGLITEWENPLMTVLFTLESHASNVTDLPAAGTNYVHSHMIIHHSRNLQAVHTFTFPSKIDCFLHDV